MSCSIFDLVTKVAGRGTTRAIFAKGDFLSCNETNVPTRFVDLGRMSNMDISQDPEYAELTDWSCGKRETVDKLVLENGFEFMGTLHDISRQNLQFAFRGKDKEVETQAALTAMEIDPIDFSSESSDPKFYHTLTKTTAGKTQPVYGLTNLVVETAGGATLVEGEGEDYVYIKSEGLIRFLTVQNEALTITADAPAATVTPLELGADQTTKGWLRLLHTPTIDTDGNPCDAEMIWDVPVIMSYEDSLEFNTDDFATIPMKFTARRNPVLRDLRVVS